MAKRKRGSDPLEGRSWVIPKGPFKGFTATVEGRIPWRLGWHYIRITGPEAYNNLFSSEDGLIVEALGGGVAADVDGLDAMAPAPRRAYDVVSGIMAYEQGDMSEGQAAELFQHLIDTGTIRHLQGHYGREAERMARAGLVRLSDGPDDVERADRKAAGKVSAAITNEQIREGRKRGNP